jgi:hypothetical protein
VVLIVDVLSNENFFIALFFGTRAGLGENMYSRTCLSGTRLSEEKNRGLFIFHPKNRFKWEIPASTSISENGFLLATRFGASVSGNFASESVKPFLRTSVTGNFLQTCQVRNGFFFFERRS